jgi:hypothetical protein
MPALAVGREAKLCACCSRLSRVVLSKAEPPDRSPAAIVVFSRSSSFWWYSLVSDELQVFGWNLLSPDT